MPKLKGIGHQKLYWKKKIKAESFYINKKKILFPTHLSLETLTKTNEQKTAPETS